MGRTNFFVSYMLQICTTNFMPQNKYGRTRKVQLSVERSRRLFLLHTSTAAVVVNPSLVTVCW
jgi:hypothetical protein